jgi:hypothetical protein
MEKLSGLPRFEGDDLFEVIVALQKLLAVEEIDSSL